MRDTVAIVGSHPEWRELAPWKDKDVDIWVFNEVVGQANSWVRRWDAVFQMHLPTIYRNANNRCDPHHWRWLQQDHGKPVYMLDVDPDVPSSVKYPLEELDTHLLIGFERTSAPGDKDKADRRYFTSTIAYAVALAIHKGYRRILVYGVEMSSNTEYTWQRDCVAYWVGMAIGKGIAVEYYGGDAIFSRPLYGYDGYIEADIEGLEARKAELDKELEIATKERQRCERVLAKRWEEPSQHLYNLQVAHNKEGAIEGHLHEAERYLFKCKAMKDESGFAFIDRNEYEGAAAGAKPEIEKHGAEVYRTAGKIDYVMTAWMQTKDPEALKQVKTFCNLHVQAAHQSGYHQGIFTENLRLAQELDYHLTAAGGTKALDMLVEGLPTPARPDG